MNEAYIFDAVRTPLSKGKEGSLYEVKPIRLLEIVLDALKSRNGLDTKEIDDLVVGCVTPVADQGGNIAKTALMFSDWDNLVQGVQINRFSASGLEAINLAAMKIRSGWENMVIGGGLECMSRVPIGDDGGPLMYDPEVSTRIGYVPYGVVADFIATKEGITRQELDEFAYQSHQKAALAQKEERFSRSLIPILDRNNLTILDNDEAINPAIALEDLEAHQPMFVNSGAVGHDEIVLRKYPYLEKINHLHTPGNSATIVDAASLILIGSKAKGKAMGLKPRAKIIGALTTGGSPSIINEAATLATQKVLAQANLSIEDIDLFEVNESYAGPTIKYQRDLGISPEQLNVNGGSIAMGNPMGALGSILMTNLLDELERRKLKRGLIALNVGGGGTGIATIVELVGEKG